MNDDDYRSTLECLRIAARLIMPLDLDGFLKRIESAEQGEADRESLGLRRLARIAKAIRDEDGMPSSSACVGSGAARQSLSVG
jgi:hypothetical protein